MQILGKNVPGRENSMQDKGHEAGLCFACSRKYREAQLPGLRVNGGQCGEGLREIMGARWCDAVWAAVRSLNTLYCPPRLSPTTPPRPGTE